MKDNSKADVSNTEEFDEMYKEMVKAMEEKNCTRYKHAEVKDLAAKSLRIKEEIPIPDNCEVWDDKGNVISTSKIIIREKKKEYPKTYEECCKVLGYDDRETYCIFHTGADERLFEALYRLKVCRDAYWKIAGEEMGWGKPWKPSGNEECFVISRSCGEVYLYSCAGDSEPFEFPTAEMRDAFKKNFDPDIEFCKELL